MSWQTLRSVHGGKGRVALNRALRAEIPGAAQLLDATQSLQREADNPRRDRHPAQVRAIREASVALKRLLDGLRKAIMESYGIRGADADEPAQKETRPVAGASEQDQSSPCPTLPLGLLQSTPAGGEATLSLAALRPSSLGDAHDNRQWTPPLAIVELMGKLSAEELAKMAGVSSQTIRREMDRLGIAPFEGDKDAHRWTPAMDKLLGTATDDELGKRWGRDGESVRRRREKLGVRAHRRKQAWTPERLAILRAEPDNVKAAAALGISVAAVKTARSRLKP